MPFEGSTAAHLIDGEIDVDEDEIAQVAQPDIDRDDDEEKDVPKAPRHPRSLHEGSFRGLDRSSWTISPPIGTIRKRRIRKRGWKRCSCD